MSIQHKRFGKRSGGVTPLCEKGPVLAIIDFGHIPCHICFRSLSILTSRIKAEGLHDRKTNKNLNGLKKESEQRHDGSKLVKF